MKKVKLSVGKMVGLLMRCGDIDSRYAGKSVMLDGAKMHRKIQKAMGEHYQKEVSLSLLLCKNEFGIELFGRADGLILSGGEVTVDEIKTTVRPLETVDNGNNMHWAQAKCYAYMYMKGLENPPESITVQLTYCQIDTQEIKRYTKSETLDELEIFVEGLIEKYIFLLEYEMKHKEKRNLSLEALEFPFKSYRKGQRKLAAAVYRTVESENHLFACAPTGTGKTVSTIFPTLKAMGRDMCDKLFYLTAKTITRQAAQDTFELLKKTDKNLCFKYITLTAKDKICFCEQTKCNPENCKYAKGHYDRVNDAVFDTLDSEEALTREIVEKYAKKYSVCPYELSLDLAEWADAVVCDYNYVFDPVVYLHRFFGDENTDRFVFLIDESHNLPDRAREMYSAPISKGTVYEAIKLFSNKRYKVYKKLQNVNKYFIELRNQIAVNKYLTEKEKPEELYKLLSELTSVCDEWLAENEGHPAFEKMLEIYFSALFFIQIYETCNESYITISQLDRDVTVTLFCIDPSQRLAEKYQLARAVIFFSATMTPISFYREVLGGKEDFSGLRIQSPFDRDKLKLSICDSISTKYIHREKSAEKITDSIYDFIKEKGNYIAYFPSYSYMKQIFESFVEKYPEVTVLLQKTGMSEEEKEEFLGRFDVKNTETLLGFCVLGGIFSEGIDLKGNRLNGAVIVGVGLPKISPVQDVIKDYYNQKGGKGYEYAYMYPGMNKVLQAAGRVIRTESDTGAVLLIESRFTTQSYLALFPEHWRGFEVV